MTRAMIAGGALAAVLVLLALALALAAGRRALEQDVETAAETASITEMSR